MSQRFSILLSKISTISYSPRYSRLAGDLACYWPILEKRIAETVDSKVLWADKATKLMKDSEKFLEQNKIDEAWKCFHTAKRLEVYAMKDDERLSIAKALIREAEKLNEWRKDAIINLIGGKDGVVPIPSVADLFNAIEIKDEAYNNQYYLNRLSRNLFWLLSGLLFLVISGIVFYFWYIIYLFGENYSTKLDHSELLIGVLLFGLLGALTSAIVSTRALPRSSQISELGSSEVITMSKIFIGAGFSIFIFLLLKSSIADKIDLFSFKISSPLDYFAIAFASGFTERLAQKSIGLLIGKEKADEQKKQSAVKKTD